MFAQAVADEHGVDSGSYARTMLFTPDLDAADVRRYGGAIAAIARDAAFSGWEAEAPDTPGRSGATSTATLLEVAGRYIDRIIETAGPRVVVIDDLHWIDPSSVGMVEVLVERAARAPLVVLVGDAARVGRRRGRTGRASNGSTSAGSRCPRRRSSRPRSRAPRSMPTTRGGSTSGPRATRCSSPRPSGRSSRTGRWPGTTAG